ncbi:MAG: DUF1330 domain-containing protein [Burkholderiales bacterium]|nr:DUF1330 domain-containing protein [Burkholderiales bacterium]
MAAPAYLIVESQVTDPDAFRRYMDAAPPVIKAFVGEYLVRGGRMAVLEGDWQPPRLTVLRFPDFDTARRWHDSPEYTAVRALRQGATACFNMVLVEGVDAPV